MRCGRRPCWPSARLLTAVPPRARRYLQLALVVGAGATVVALPLIYRQGTQPASKALLLRDYGAT